MVEEEAAARLSEQRKQLDAMAAAQAERETALHDREEALKQRARVARVRNFALVLVSIFSLGLAGWLGLRSELQKIIAEQLLEGATRIIVKLQPQMDSDTKEQASSLFKTGAIMLGHPLAEYNLAVYYTNGFGVPQDYAKARELYEKAAAKDYEYAMNNLGGFYERGHGGPQDYAKAREWYEKAAAKDHAGAMANLGVLYENGRGVPQDYAKARELYEKAADKGDADAMKNLGVLYETGRGVTQDYAKAREWWEKAAAKDQAQAMYNLGVIYQNGHGVARDYAKAREWWEKAAAKGDESAKMVLEQLQIREASTTGRYAEALQLQEALAAKVEAEESKRDGKPGEQTARELSNVIWLALVAKEFTKALTVANRSHALFPEDLGIETNRAHALMFMESGGEAKALYLAHKGKPVSPDNRLWERVIVEDFGGFRKAGLTHPMMADIETELGVSR